MTKHGGQKQVGALPKPNPTSTPPAMPKRK
jgi:hypothetical protein